MIFEPVKILHNKIPFIEFSLRTAKLIWNPKIESIDEFKSGDSRFGLLDIVLSLSLLTIFYSIGYALTGDAYYGIAQSLLIKTNMIFSLGFFSIPPLISFTLLTFVFFFFKNGFERAKGDTLVCSMHFARVYSLNLLILTPFIVWYVDLLSSKFISYEEYANNNLLQVSIMTITSIILLIRCLFIPLKKYILPSKSKVVSFLISYPLIVLLVYSSFELSQHIPSPIKLKFDSVFSCDRIYKSIKFSNLSVYQKQRFLESCEASSSNTDSDFM